VPVFGPSPISRERKRGLQSFQKAAGLKFRNLELLNRSFIHRSCSNEDSGEVHNNERLEFLGDSVLGVVVSSYLYTHLVTKPEGELARVKSFVVSEDSLSVIAKALGVDRYMLVGRGEELSGGRQKKAILADAVEAIIGACYLDSGFAAAEKFILKIIVPEIEKVLQNKHKKDYKTILQEFVQKKYQSYPKYVLERKSGPDHDRTFWVSVSVEGRNFGEADGKNKKEAEQKAARLAFESILADRNADSEALRSIDSL
jgi:ribonuclease III